MSLVFSVWISPLFPKLKGDSSSFSNVAGDSPTHFKKDILAYISAYKSVPLNVWEKHVHDHDMSAAKLVSYIEFLFIFIFSL